MAPSVAENTSTRGVWITACPANSMAFRVKEIDPTLNPPLAEWRENREKQLLPHLRLPARGHDGFARLYGDIMEAGTLDRRLKESESTAVSMVNECNYCTHHHEDTARKVGLSDREIEDIRNSKPQGFDPGGRAALRYAASMTRGSPMATRGRASEILPPTNCVDLTLIVCQRPSQPVQQRPQHSGGRQRSQQDRAHDLTWPFLSDSIRSSSVARQAAARTVLIAKGLADRASRNRYAGARDGHAGAVLKTGRSRPVVERQIPPGRHCPGSGQAVRGTR